MTHAGMRLVRTCVGGCCGSVCASAHHMHASQCEMSTIAAITTTTRITFPDLTRSNIRNNLRMEPRTSTGTLRAELSTPCISPDDTFLCVCLPFITWQVSMWLYMMGAPCLRWCPLEASFASVGASYVYQACHQALQSVHDVNAHGSNIHTCQVSGVLVS